jgi:hypothetical protein
MDREEYYKWIEENDTYPEHSHQWIVKTYEMVVECRKNTSIMSIDKVCGELPVFVNKVS